MNDFVVSLLLLGALSQGGDVPFWATSGRYGIMPDTSGGLALLQAGMPFDDGKTLQWHWGASVGLKGETGGVTCIPDELYAGIRWKCLRLDVGLWHTEQSYLVSGSDLGTLSVTGGNIMKTGNSRSLPGYAISLEPFDVPFTDGRLQVLGRFGDFATTDDRYVKGALVHNTEIYLRAGTGRHLTLTFGADHYTMWGGVSPVYGPLAVSAGNYLRVLTGRRGAQDSPVGDQINALGDHRGRILFRLDWAGTGWSASYQHDKPYEDRSSLWVYNYPDAVRTLHFSLSDKSRLLTDMVYEFHTTMNQSGPYERRLATEEEIASGSPRLYRATEDSPWYYIAGGADNYCNNYEYKSGWTHYGRQIGNPLFFSRPNGHGTWNNLLTAHHFAFAGRLFKAFPWKLMLTWSRNYGCWFTEDYSYDTGSRLKEPLRQFSSCFMTEFPVLGGALGITPSVYLDLGDALPHSFAVMLTLKYNILHTPKE